MAQHAPIGRRDANTRLIQITPAPAPFLSLLVPYVTMVHGPIAAALVELLLTRIQYTLMSLPYRIGMPG